jgi:hypothetical protein
MLYRFDFWVRCGRYAARVLEPGGAAKLRGALRRALTRARNERSVRAFAHKPKTASDEIQKAFDWAWAGYRPRPYRGRAAFIEAKDEFLHGRASELRRLASSSERVWLPGDHDAIVTTYVADLAAEIGKRLHESREHRSR